jgi:hypothetical protein
VHVRVEPRHRRGLSDFRARISKFELRSSKFSLLALAVAVLTAAAAGGACRRTPAPSDITITLTVTPQAPVAGEPVDVHLSLRDAGHHAIAGAAVQLEAHMTHPGMAPVIEPAPERGDGDYVARPSLTMAGDWVLFADVRTADGQRVRKEIGRLSARSGG